MPIENGDKVKLEYLEKDCEKNSKSLEKLSDAYKVINHNSTQIATDVAWLKRFFWIIATAAVGGLVSSLIQLLKL